MSDRGHQTRKRFYRAFEKELSERGYQRMSVASLVRRNRSSKGAFYHHFRSLDDLLFKWYREHTRQTEKQVVNAVHRGQSVAATLQTDILRTIDDMPDEPAILSILEIWIAASRQPTLGKGIAADYRAKLRLAADALCAGQKSGELRDDFDPDAASRLIYALCFGVYLIHFATREPGRIAAKVDGCLEVLFDGLRARSAARAARGRRRTRARTDPVS